MSVNMTSIFDMTCIDFETLLPYTSIFFFKCNDFQTLRPYISREGAKRMEYL